MKLWWLTDFVRLAEEKRAIEATAAGEQWFELERWYFHEAKLAAVGAIIEDLMARFDVYEVTPLSSVPLVLDVQADLLSDLQTRVVIPLKPHKATKRPAQPRLEPVLLIGGRKYVLMTADIGTVQLADLQGAVTNLDNQRTVVIDAIDFLLQGF